MGLFNFGKNKKESAPQARDMQKEPKKVQRFETQGVSSVAVAKSLLGARITEKATLLSEQSNVHTFNVSADATKNSIADAVSKLYKVNPVKIRIVSIPRKKVFVRGKWGMKGGGRKAYVYLKQGEKIAIA